MSPPEASWITEKVESRVLTSTVVMRGDVRPDLSMTIGVPSSVEGAGVLTRLPAAAGTELEEGAQVFEVSGRPVFILQGEVPVYRSMGPGDVGIDILQLQAALTRLGYSTESDGVFGKATARAVNDFYAAAWYVPEQPFTVAFGEMIFVPSFPARVQSSVTTLGPIGSSSGDPGQQVTDGSLVRLSTGALRVTTTIRADADGLLRVGMALQLLDEVTNTTFAATLTSIADQPSTDASGQTGRAAIVTPDEPLPATLVGANLRLTFTTAASDGEVLVVPLAAVSSSADGATRVSVLRAGKKDPVDVQVNVGISADGFVAVEPLETDGLKVGDLVVVGR